MELELNTDPFEPGHRLWAMAQKDTHQGRHVAHLLAGLYNGPRFPLDLTRLRGLDEQVLSDCLAVLYHASAYSRPINEVLGIHFSEFDAMLREQGLSKSKT